MVFSTNLRVSLKEYAKNKGITYEAARKSFNRYKNKELENHYVKENRTTFLDAYAVEFLDKKRASNPIVIIENNRDEEIERLKLEKEQLELENKALLIKVGTLQEELLKEKDEVKFLQNKQIELLETKKKKWWWR